MIVYWLILVPSGNWHLNWFPHVNISIVCLSNNIIKAACDCLFPYFVDYKVYESYDFWN